MLDITALVYINSSFIFQVALLQMALSDGFCVLVRTCQIEKFPESLKEILARYDVIKLGVAVGEDGKKVTLIRSFHP